MFGKSLPKLLAFIAVFALIFSLVSGAKAARIDLGGDEDDNLWTIDTLYCRDGFSITTTHTHLSAQTNLSFWLELASSTISVKLPAGAIVDARDSNDPNQTPLLARIAHGDGSSLINDGKPFTWNYFFNEPQKANTTNITTTIERWDHGNPTIVEEDRDGDLGLDADNDNDTLGNDTDRVEDLANNTLDHFDNETGEDDFTDESNGDDLITDTHTIGDCLIDSTAPTIAITSPLAQNYLQTATVPTTWNVTDNLSGVASSSGMVDGTSVTNGQAFNLFTLSPGSHTLTVNAADNSGNTAQSSVNFNVVVTTDSLITATQRACSLGWISNASICQSLLAKLAAAKTALARGQTQVARNTLNAYLAALQAQKGKFVNQSAFDLLNADAKYLLSTL